MPRKFIIALVTIPVLFIGGLYLRSHVGFDILNLRFFATHQIETLRSPVAVTNWREDGLHLADGRTVQLPGFRCLPRESPALAEATKRGVEIHPDGRVWGLVAVHHWCGNDPVREHIARVDLSDMMIFLRVGTPVAVFPDLGIFAVEPGGRFSKWGWEVGEFVTFRSWASTRASVKPDKGLTKGWSQ